MSNLPASTPANTSKNTLVKPGEFVVPAIIADLGDDAVKRFVEFFAAHIRNPNTRTAYAHAARRFFAWCPLPLHAIEPIHVAAYVELLGQELSAPTVKQHLAAIRMLFDWLIVGQVMQTNPASAVRGPKHVVKKGKTPILAPEELRALFAAIRTDTVVGLRDRAFLALLFYTFARVSAAIQMPVRDYYPQRRRLWVRLREKGGKHLTIPCHHTLEEYLSGYVEAAGIAEDKKGPLFRSARGRTGVLTERPLQRRNALDLIRRRLKDAGIDTVAGNHSFRASGITVYLKNDGKLEHAQYMAGHASARTTKLYDRREDEVSLDEVERIVI